MHQGSVWDREYRNPKLDQEGNTIFKQAYLDAHIDDEIKAILGRINLTFPKGTHYKKIEDMVNNINEFTSEKILNYLDDYISEFALEPNPVNLSKIGDVNFLRRTLTDYFELKK
jgi:t-SNARE complex subunit (syntaxin)